MHKCPLACCLETRIVGTNNALGAGKSSSEPGSYHVAGSGFGRDMQRWARTVTAASLGLKIRCGECPGVLGTWEVPRSWWHWHSLYLLPSGFPCHLTLGISDLQQSRLLIVSALDLYFLCFLYMMIFWHLKTFLAGERLHHVELANP